MPKILGTTLEVLVGLSWQRENPRENKVYPFLPIFRTFLGEYSSMLLFDVHADFFGRFDPQRNYFIRSVELFEESPILLLSRRLEACER